MSFRFAFVGLLALCAQATLTATTPYGFGSAPPDISLVSETTHFVAGSWTEIPFAVTQHIDCVLGLADTGHICGNPGPSSAVNVGIPAAPGNSGILPNTITNYLMADGDPNWGAPVWTSLTGLTVAATYQISFFQATREENGNNKAYNDNWHLIPGAVTGDYLCPQSFCGVTTQTSIDSGDLAYNSTVMANSGGVSTNWGQETFTFQATKANTVLEFVTNAVAVTSGAFQPPLLALADVTMTNVSLGSTVPEPGRFGLMILGAGLIIVARIWRRRASARE